MINFKNGAIFSGIKFLKESNFSGTIFKKYVDFSESFFKEKTNNLNAHHIVKPIKQNSLMRPNQKIITSKFHLTAPIKSRQKSTVVPTELSLLYQRDVASLTHH